MKTTSDIAAFVKRNGTLRINFRGKDQKFVAFFTDLEGIGESKHLDDALENLAEALRREGSGTTLKPQHSEPGFVTASYTGVPLKPMGGPTTSQPVVAPSYPLGTTTFQITFCSACGGIVASGNAIPPIGMTWNCTCSSP